MRTWCRRKQSNSAPVQVCSTKRDQEIYTTHTIAKFLVRRGWMTWTKNDLQLIFLCLPKAGTSMACDLGESEKHDRVVSGGSYGSVLWPVVCEVMYGRSICWCIILKHGLAYAPFWVVGWCHYFNVSCFLVCISLLELGCISCPSVLPWLLKADYFWICLPCRQICLG